ncbi:restriction endonuclease subunit S [Photobacterium leiognathi]|uniref:restriction endonuclease subunit S n=1 Tax=Photobacterium leiognathi TaxID=553611 RepID=UPI0029823034|nr:restriction endonuclease subunit S [Photobacterium leiognathi]
MSSLPKLRLSEFSDSNTYCLHKFDDMFSFSSGKNIKQNEASPEFSTPCVRYGELYHMYGEVITKTINNTNLERSELTFSAGNEILLPSAGEDPLDIGSASALTLKGVAIGRTINVLRPKGTIYYSHIYVSYYINEKLRKRISQLARGASISNVYNSDLKTLKAYLPSFPEQQKVASFLLKVDEKVALLTDKKNKLTEYKKGVMQQLFNGKWESKNGQQIFVPPTLRFKADDGNEFPDWETRRLKHYLSVRKDKNIDLEFSKQDVLSVSGAVGVVNQIEFQGRSFAGASVAPYRIVRHGDVVYTKSPLKLNPYGIIRSNKGKDGIVSTLYAVYKCKSNIQHEFLDYYFQLNDNTNRYLRPLVNKGAKNDMKVNDSTVLNDPVCIPNKREQIKIVNFLSTIDQKIDLAKLELEKAKEWKKGLLQQMFV